MTMMMSLDQIQHGLRDRRLYVVAEETGVSYPTLKKLSEGSNSDYNTKTLKLVSAYLMKSHIKEGAD